MDFFSYINYEFICEKNGLAVTSSECACIITRAGNDFVSYINYEFEFIYI